MVFLFVKIFLALNMIYRQAEITDITQIQIVRHSVNENTLSDPALVTDADCVNYITQRGKGWVCELNNEIVGFAIVDLKEIISGRCSFVQIMKVKVSAKRFTI